VLPSLPPSFFQENAGTTLTHREITYRLFYRCGATARPTDPHTRAWGRPLHAHPTTPHTLTRSMYVRGTQAAELRHVAAGHRGGVSHQAEGRAGAAQDHRLLRLLQGLGREPHDYVGASSPAHPHTHPPTHPPTHTNTPLHVHKLREELDTFRRFRDLYDLGLLAYASHSNIVLNREDLEAVLSPTTRSRTGACPVRAHHASLHTHPRTHACVDSQGPLVCVYVCVQASRWVDNQRSLQQTAQLLPASHKHPLVCSCTYMCVCVCHRCCSPRSGWA
jgi:hypothetical protein